MTSSISEKAKHILELLLDSPSSPLGLPAYAIFRNWKQEDLPSITHVTEYKIQWMQFKNDWYLLIQNITYHSQVFTSPDQLSDWACIDSDDLNPEEDQNTDGRKCWYSCNRKVTNILTFFDERIYSKDGYVCKHCFKEIRREGIWCGIKPLDTVQSDLENKNND